MVEALSWAVCLVGMSSHLTPNARMEHVPKNQSMTRYRYYIKFVALGTILGCDTPAEGAFGLGTLPQAEATADGLALPPPVGILNENIQSTSY